MRSSLFNRYIAEYVERWLASYFTPFFASRQLCDGISVNDGIRISKYNIPRLTDVCTPYKNDKSRNITVISRKNAEKLFGYILIKYVKKY